MRQLEVLLIGPLSRFGVVGYQDQFRDLFDGYMDCFNRLDAPGAAAYYSAPSFVIKNGGVTRFGPEEKAGYFEALMESNAAEGDHKWELAEFGVTLSAANGAIATVRWIARQPDGSVI